MSVPSTFAAEDFLNRHWSAISARLGERRAAFLELVHDRARERGFAGGVLAARFANLCFAFGSGFEGRPENEWALAILLDERLAPWVKLHQLAVRGAAELRRRPGDGAALAAQLLATDALAIDAFDKRLQAPSDMVLMSPSESIVRPRVACDIEAVELRLLDAGWRQEYHCLKGQWLRRAVEAPGPLRIDSLHPAPERITVLTRTVAEDAPVRIQVRQIQHGRCALGLHPAVRWQGDRADDSWRDEGARAPAWGLTVPSSADAPRLLAETWPEITRLQVPSCGLRDEGVPFGSIEVRLWAYAAHQSLFMLQREAKLGFALPDPKSSPPAVMPTICKLERDGNAQDAAAWVQGFDHDLPERLADGMKKLLEAWQPHVQEASLRAEIGLFDGKAGITWGWREGPRGLASPPAQRVTAELDLGASGELHLVGQVEFAGARARLHLRIEGQARLQTLIERLHGDVPLLEALQASELRWRWPVQLDFDPVADHNGIVFSEVGPCTGALTGSFGLRPAKAPGGGWEWFATMAVEPVATRVVVHDPLLGRSESHMALLGTVSLLDWSLA